MRKTTESFDHATGILYIHHTEDIQPHLDDVAHERNDGSDGWSKSRNWRKIGSIPLIVVEQILREEGINLMDNNSPEARKRVRRWLNENEKFKLSTKRLRT